MKKTLILFCLVSLCGCAAIKNTQYKRNPNCTGVKELKVFQVFDGGALATTRLSDEIVVYLPDSARYQLYDGAKIQRQSNECIVFDGVYKYTTAGKDTTMKYIVAGKEKSKIEVSSEQREKTVPIVKFEKRWLDLD